jgi:hypothetical protein
MTILLHGKGPQSGQTNGCSWCNRIVIPRVCDFISFAKKPLLKTNSLDTSKIAKNQQSHNLRPERSVVEGPAVSLPVLTQTLQAHAIRIAPAAINRTPAALAKVIVSPRSGHASSTTKTTLSLSMGATLDASPMESARK